MLKTKAAVRLVIGSCARNHVESSHSDRRRCKCGHARIDGWLSVIVANRIVVLYDGIAMLRNGSCSGSNVLLSGRNFKPSASSRLGTAGQRIAILGKSTKAC